MSDNIPHHPQQRRERENPLEDAKFAINNPTPMTPEARVDLLSGALVSINSNQDRFTLINCCIKQGWICGMNMLITCTPLKDLETKAYLDFVVTRSHLNQATRLEMVRSFVNKGCSVNVSRYMNTGNGKFIVSNDLISNEMFYKPSVFGTSVFISINFVQVVVQKNKPTILSLILPKLDFINLRLALIESIGADIKDCCDTLVNFLTSSHPQLDFAILLTIIYHRSSLLEKLLTKAKESPDLIKILQTKKFDRLNEFSPLPPGAPKEQTLLEATVYFNNSEGLEMINEVVFETEKVWMKVVKSLLQRCIDKDFTECVMKFLRHWNFHSSGEDVDSILVQILYSALQGRCNLFIITNLIKKMKKTIGCKNCLNNILFKCAENCWFEGLFVLVSSTGFETIVGSSQKIKENALKTLKELVSYRFGPHTHDIIKHLVCSLVVQDADLTHIFKDLLLKKKDFNLVKLLLSFKNNKIIDAAKILLPQVTDENLKKLIRDAINPNKVKVEQCDDSQVNEDDTDDEEDSGDDDDDDDDDDVANAVTNRFFLRG